MTSATTDTASPAQILAAMPKADLHCHLDGALRLDTITDLARQQDMSLPVPPDRLAEICVAPDDCRDLMEVLSYFALPVRLLQTASALERVTYELCEDVARENVRYFEIRFAPLLHRDRGMAMHEIIEAVVRGWESGRLDFDLAGGVILCSLRQMSPDVTMETARAGVPFLGKGVVGFDLAGDEARFPVLLHREPLLWARSAGYGMTVHAGEASGAQSVRDAIEVIGASRVGHGVRSDEDPSLLPELRRKRITLEMCPTSNAQTKSVPDLSKHPLHRYYREGVQVTVNTDNRTVSDTTMTHELGLAHEYMGLEPRELADMTLTAVRAGFGEPGERHALLTRMEQEMGELGLQI